MSSIPLPALDVKAQQPQDNPLDMFSRVMQVRGLQNAQALQQAQLTGENLKNQGAQLELQDDQKWRAALSDPNWDGTPESLLKNGLKLGVGPRSYLAMQQGLVQAQQGLATLGKQRLDVFNAVNDKLGDLLETVRDAKPEDKLTVQREAKEQALSLITATPGLDSQVRAGLLQHVQAVPDDAYVGDDALTQMIGLTKLHSTIGEEALKKAQASEATQKGREAAANATIAEQNAALSPGERALQGNLYYEAAKGAPGAQAALNLETQQKLAMARATEQMHFQLQQQLYGGGALNGVPPHLVGAATAAATKAGEDYAQAQSVTQRLNDMMDAARKGNVVSYQILPQEGALQITTSQGVHRINKTEIDQYAGGGSLWQRMMGHLGKQLTGASIPSSVLSDMAQIQAIQARGAQSKYQNSLRVINQNYGSKFAPVDMGGEEVRSTTSQKNATSDPFAQFGGKLRE